jgi:DeoR family suf operon transcriptional repressor
VSDAAVALPTTRRALLEILKRRGEARAEELAEALGVTVSATRQHLQTLAASGLVEHRELKGSPGRPKHVYRLAPAAEELFPKAYDQLASELVQLAEEEDPELVRRVFARRGERRLAEARQRLAGRPFAERVAELARLLDGEGYLAAFEELPDGAFRLTEHNCTIIDVAQRSDWPCLTEIDFLREALPDAQVERVAHMLGGQHLCAYRIAQRAG